MDSNGTDAEIFLLRWLGEGDKIEQPPQEPRFISVVFEKK